ncbi:peptidase M23 [Neobacillus bataviensis LMG 21833]|uniref:Peptidase M23 n=1 Tax=Neobacillus bataviensis LMG 21833 TaxID=1117379 RepID=K6DE12_9BACI|nr:M23 family metallopeptidase [Neobacillus bataviensis]EKN66519.1 peptidase M23 [Neobacillus bataviensis LMG 21833]
MREEENKRSSQGSSVKRFFKKRWVFPAIYIASAAIILTGVLWYQSSSSNTDKYDYKSTDLTGKKNQTPAVEVNKPFENFKMPVDKATEAVVKTKFYDFQGKAEDQESALVFYNNSYLQNTGIDLALKNGETFDVTASLSGTVKRVEEDATLGNVIEIEHDNGIVTQYQSVKDIKVTVGEQVKQGHVLAKAGQSLFNEKAGTHVHFEIRKDGVAVNPTSYFDKPLSALQEKSVDAPSQKKLDDLEKSTDSEKSTDKQEKSTDSEKSTDKQEKSTDDQKSPVKPDASSENS